MINRNILLCLLLVVAVSSGQAQLRDYKKIFVKEHALLNAAQLDIDYSVLEYEKSKKDRQPSLTLNTQYSLRNGGRTYAIPTGDLLNPVYHNLNYLNTSDFPSDGTNLYPRQYGELENTSINFLRTKEYDANLTARIPLLDFSVRENINSKKMEEDLAKLQYQQLLKSEWSNFKINYFSYFKRKELIGLLETKKKKTQAFYDKLRSQKNNQKIVENRLKKVELDQFKIEIEIREQEALLANDKAFLLKVLGKNASEEIILEELVNPFQLNYSIEEILEMWAENNTHSRLINQRSKILENKILQSQESYKPTLDLRLTSGLQGENFNAEEKPLYLSGALQLNWNLYNPKRNIENKQIKIIVKKNAMENQNNEENTAHQIKELFNKINLEENKLDYCSKSITYLESIRFEMEKKYKEGKATYHEVYDALLDIEGATLDYTKSKFDHLLLVCELEKLIGVELFK